MSEIRENGNALGLPNNDEILAQFRDKAAKDLRDFAARMRATYPTGPENTGPKVVYETAEIQTQPKTRKERQRPDDEEPTISTVTPPTPACCSFQLPERRISLANAGYFLPAYDRAARPSTEAGFRSQFRHYCDRKLVFDYDRDGGTISNRHTYIVLKDGSGSLVDGPEITGWFTPTPSDVDDVIAQLIADGRCPDFSPPGTGVLRISLYVEFHRDLMKRDGTLPSYSQNRIDFDNDETNSIPCAQTLCYQILS